MKEEAILIVLKTFIDLMLPNYATGACEVDEAKEVCASGTVCDEHEGAL